MADETRTVIIDVEVEDKDFDQEIGNVNTALKENRALIKELSKDYKGNAKEIAKLEAENRDLSKSKQSLAKESKAEAAETCKSDKRTKRIKHLHRGGRCKIQTTTRLNR